MATGWLAFAACSHAVDGLKVHHPDQPKGDALVSYPIPWIDLNSVEQWQVTIDREANQYLGHPTTCLLDDGQTMHCVYPKGHGRGAIVYKKSLDGGRTWSDRLPRPRNWDSSLETPTIHRTVDQSGKKRIIMFSGLYPARLATSEDEGETWSPLEPIGEWGGIVVMGSVIALQNAPGHYMAFFHDDGRYFQMDGQRADPTKMTLYHTKSTDGGLTWSFPKEIYASSEVHLCEPGIVRSPDSTELAMLLRENTRRRNSHIMFSQDEGETWSPPRELPASLTGDRHTGKYLPDGRLFISFRDRTPNQSPRDYDSPTEGDWVAWVGTYDDLKQGDPGDFRIRLKDNLHAADCAYPGVEVLPDGTIVTTTYGHWGPRDKYGNLFPYILAIRFNLDDLVESLELPSRP